MKKGRPLSAEMTPALRSTLVYLVDYRNRYGFSPSERDIAAALGISQNGARTRLQALERRGMIRRSQRVRHRSIQVTQEGVAVALNS